MLKINIFVGIIPVIWDAIPQKTEVLNFEASH